MSILRSTTVRLSALVFAMLLYGCGESTTPSKDEGADASAQPSGQVVARVNGEEITIHELNNELALINANDENRDKIRRDILKSLVTRTLFEQNAKNIQLDRSPAVMMEIERSKSSLLSKAYIQSQIINAPVVTRKEAEDYVLDNPNIFSERAHYQFDTLVVSNTYLTLEKREAWEKVTNLDEIESVLLAEGVEYKRIPFGAHTEQLSAPIRNNIQELKLSGDAFYMVFKNNTYISIYKESRPAVLSGTAAISVATQYLNSVRIKEFLVKLEKDVTSSATVEFFGDFSSLATSKKMDDEEVKNKADSVVSKPKEKTEDM